MERKTVKINFVDLNDIQEVVSRYMIDNISIFADVEISDNPDYIFYGPYGCEHLNYDCVKIYFQCEEEDPNFNICDYAIGYININYYDRYLMQPIYSRSAYKPLLNLCMQKHTKPDEYYLDRSKFCNFIYSNGDADPFRKAAYLAINEYKHVDSAGRYMNNMGNKQIAGDRYLGDWQKAKREFMKDYKFTIAFGNCQKPGYADEKVFDAWIAGTVPIFWGDNTFSETFNPKAYIDCTKCKTPQEVVEKVKVIAEDEEKYLAMQKEPIVLPNSKYYTDFTEEKMIAFLKNIFMQTPQDAKRISQGIYMVEAPKTLRLGWRVRRTIFYRGINRLKRIYRNIFNKDFRGT